MIDSVAGAVVRPRPPPSTSIWPTISQYGVATETREIQAKATDMSPSPVATTRVVPNRSASRGDVTAIAAIAVATGIVRSPASSGPYPRISWKYWVTRKMKPNRAKKAEVTATLAALNRRLRKIRTGSIGCSGRPSPIRGPR
jgi:hypothetical protein